MSNKKYISQVLSCLALGMLIPILVMLSIKIYIKRIDVSFYFLVFLWIISYILEIFFNSFCEKYKKVIWLCCQIVSYFLFWITTGLILGFFSQDDNFIYKIVMSVYGFAILVTIICLLIGLFSKNIKIAKKRNFILGTCLSVMIIIFTIITKSGSYLFSLALIFIAFLCCVYSVKQFNDLKIEKSFNSGIEKWTDIISTATDMSLTFITFVFTILAMLFPPSDDDDD
ncbi:hypothetical protein [Ligilactobacillus aviarius]|uniref:Uncharacterized protein n=1 Tax=Ligilactobacillus aviarius TaxID=1606 RepID=A0A179C217_9LACO|nr:hypothetical protein [Ligilactobacillus aviarius]HJD08576.1 hypothetical protein [Candidatus Ligilactobacillus faecavium]HJF16718.1 hypothetical protein [Globicatella sulfidifaciens]OAP98698.1 hypothetical protein A3O08_06255 [Ligilactobacillus aviarius]OAP99595.1 hypothetical protein A3O07_04025 [Ligilactobacillus aviarius]OAP99779.1 hypothetical protein A3O09_05590 [Ligilactobacillus aviarius]